MNTPIKIISLFFAPAVFALYCWGAFKLVGMVVTHPPLTFLVTGFIVVLQVLVVFAAGEAGFLEPDPKFPDALEGKIVGDSRALAIIEEWANTGKVEIVRSLTGKGYEVGHLASNSVATRETLAEAVHAAAKGRT
jgi:hypothetical protein